MPSKDAPLKKLNAVGGPPGGPAGEVLSRQEAPLPPPPPALPAPTDLALTSELYESAVTPSALLVASWRPPAGILPEGYDLEWSRDPSFAASETQGATGAGAAVVVRAGTAYYARVRARAAARRSPWSAVASHTTVADTSPPGPVSGVGTAWEGGTGDLTITWASPASPNLKDVRVRIFSAPGGTLYHEGASATGAYTWTGGQHRQDLAGGYDPGVAVELVARSWGGVLSTPVTVTANLPAPAQPTGLTTSWDGDDGTAGAGLLLTWTASTLVARYRLVLDGAARDVLGGRYVYDPASNAAEHGGAMDPQIAVSLVALDFFGQASPAATRTAANAAPPATGVSAFGAFSTVGLTIAPSPAADLRDYRVRAYRDGVLLRTLWTAETRPLYAAEDGSGSYQFDVAARDAFGQVGPASALTAALPLTDLTQFVATLREGLVYTDTAGTGDEALRQLKDGNLVAGGITYPAGWHTTTGDWQERVTHQTTELGAGPALAAYLGVSADGLIWSWYSGGTAAGGRWRPVAVASEAAARAAPASLSAGAWRVDLPAPVPARYIRLGHFSDGPRALHEFFPSTLIRGTYVEAESITAVQIAAGAIVADKIGAGAIDGFVITGALIRTASDGARVELTSGGLRSYDGAGNAVIELGTTSNGKLRAGGGRIRLTRTTGVIHVQPSSSPQTVSPIDFLRADGATAMGLLESTITVPGQNEIGFRVFAPDGVTPGGAFYVSAGSVRLSGLVTAASGLVAGGAYVGASVPLGASGVELRYDGATNRAVIATLTQGVQWRPLLLLASSLRFFADDGAPGARVTVGGSRSAQTASVLESLLSALAGVGLITDATTP